MKKSLMSLLTLCLLLSLLAGCRGHNPTNVPDNPSDPLPAQTAGEEDRTDARPTTFRTDAEIAEICTAVRENEDHYQDPQLRPYLEGCKTFWLQVDGRPYYWYHTYPSNEWTPEEVAEYFREHPYYWGDDPTVPYDEVKIYYL